MSITARIHYAKGSDTASITFRSLVYLDPENPVGLETTLWFGTRFGGQTFAEVSWPSYGSQPALLARGHGRLVAFAAGIADEVNGLQSEDVPTGDIVMYLDTILPDANVGVES